MANQNDIPEEVKQLRREFDSALNHYYNILNFSERGIINAEDYAARKEELKAIIQQKLQALENAGYGLL
jgi:hypothetical protein